MDIPMNLDFFKSFLKPNAIFSGTIYGFIQHLIWLLKSAKYRQHALLVTRYSHYPRYKKTTLNLNGRVLEVPDIASFLSTHEELFVNEIYKFESDEASPVILDFGANIGLSILYFKYLYPLSTVIAYEADPIIFKSLKKNVGDLPGVILHNAAIWSENTSLSFCSEGADGGFIDTKGGNQTIKIDAVDVAVVLNESNADFIKMDIEGAESVVIPACKGKLANAKHIFCEYHSKINEQQELSSILSILQGEGFRVHIQSINAAHKPFITHKVQSGFDMQLNIFGWKE